MEGLEDALTARGLKHERQGGQQVGLAAAISEIKIVII
jgi:hypothetical protein